MGDDGWAEKQIPGGNYRQKSKGEGGLAFVTTHPGRKVRGEDGAPSLGVDIERVRHGGHPHLRFAPAAGSG